MQNRITITGIMNEGDLEITGQQVELKRRWLSSQKDGVVIQLTLERQTLPKTRKQCGAYFGLALAMIVEEFNQRGWDSSIIFNLPEPTGVGVTKDMLYIFFNVIFPLFNDRGNLKTVSGMNTAEMATRFDQIRNFAASQWQICIPEPRKDWQTKPDSKNGKDEG